LSASSRHRGARWLLLAAIGLPSLLLVEVGLRRLELPRFDACEPRSDFPWQPDAEVFNVLRAHAEIGVGRTNALGLRGPEIQVPRSPRVARILFVGDSTCWGLGVEYGRTFAARSAEIAARAIGQPIEIVNGCVPGHSSFQSRIMLERLMRFSPDLVVLYVGARNDVDRHRYFRDAEIPARLARREAAWHRIYVLRALEAGFDGLYKKLLRKPLSQRRRARVPPSDFRGNVEAMLDVIATHGARGIVMQPPFSAALLERHPLIPAYQEILSEVAHQSGESAVPLQPVFASWPEADVYQDDRLHFAPDGHELAAHELSRAIVASLRAEDSEGGGH
jgi:lysophospholipase L1-like esterase